MSESLLGVIVGGAIALVVAVVGYFVQAYFSKQESIRQIQARKEEQVRQFDFDKDQKTKELEFEKNQLIITHLIEERKKWIEPLRISLTEYSRDAIEVNTYLDFVRFMVNESSTADSNKRYIDELKERMTKWDKSKTALCSDTAPIGDPQLKSLVERLENAQILISLNIFIAQTFNQSTYDEMEVKIKQIRNDTAKIFRRIEDLLSGRD
jgi:hypothetical protein